MGDKWYGFWMGVCVALGITGVIVVVGSVVTTLVTTPGSLRPILGFVAFLVLSGLIGMWWEVRRA